MIVQSWKIRYKICQSQELVVVQLKRSFQSLVMVVQIESRFKNQSEFSNSSAIMENSFQNLSKSSNRSASRKSCQSQG